ncbi:MAG: SUMF1/EgtB/PvdO family nonheme iron enzyme [Turneriella sp.]
MLSASLLRRWALLVFLLFAAGVSANNSGFDPQADFVTVEGGSFEMGGPGFGQTPHKVTVQTFKMARFPVTYAQYSVFLQETKTHAPVAPPGGWNDQMPVIGVDYVTANAYCKWLSKKLGMDIRLPTEAEWEFAARGGKQSQGFTHAGSNSIGEVGWPGSGRPQPVGQRKPNELGIHDLTGNVWQWTQDWYDADFYQRGPAMNPRNAKQLTKNRVLRGGSFDYAPLCMSVFYRYFNHPEAPRYDTGFRIVTGGAFRGNQ